MSPECSKASYLRMLKSAREVKAFCESRMFSPASYLRMLKSAREVKAFCESRMLSGEDNTNVAKVTKEK